MEGETNHSQKAEEVPFPAGGNIGEQDRYFFRYTNDAARIIAEQNGLDPNNKNTVAGIAIHLNQTYTKTPEIALADIHDVLKNPVAAKRMSYYAKYDDDWRSEFPPDDDGGYEDFDGAGEEEV